MKILILGAGPAVCHLIYSNIRTFTILVGCLMLQGCTQVLWTPFFQDTVKNPQIWGAGTAGDSGTNLVVLYSLRDPDGMLRVTYFYAIPLDQKLNSKFSYKGNQRTIEGILSELATRKDLTDTSIGLSWSKELFKSHKSPSFADINAIEDTAGYRIPGSHAMLIPYRKSHTNNIPLQYLEPMTPLDPSIHFLVVPAELPRFKSEYYKSNAGIVLQTPFTTCLDVLFSPIYALILIYQLSS